MSEKVNIVNVGTKIFYEDLVLQGQDVVQVDWVPIANGNKEVMNLLDRYLDDPKVAQANQKAVNKIMQGQPVLVDIGLAKDMIPGFDSHTVLHAGPPIEFERMCGTVKGAIIGALLFEGLATTEEEALSLAASGRIKFAPAHSFNAVGPMAGIISASMPVHVVENTAFGNRAFATVNEGLGKVLRFGAYDDSVIQRLHWIKNEFMPVLKRALALVEGGIDLKLLIAQAVQMGDECHNRNKAATALFFKEIMPYLLKSGCELTKIEKAMDFIRTNDHYFLNLSMPAAKSMLDVAEGIEYSTVVTAMARNGVDFGIRLSGLGKDEWFVAKAQMVRGLLFSGYSEEDANPDLGDSTITETLGIGGFAMGASPAITQFVGGSVADAIGYTEQMREITTSENRSFSLPPLDFAGTPTGIDALKVLNKNILPIINTGIAHKLPGIGQIGAGLVNPPLDCFIEALRAYDKKYHSK